MPPRKAAKAATPAKARRQHKEAQRKATLAQSLKERESKEQETKTEEAKADDTAAIPQVNPFPIEALDKHPFSGKDLGDRIPDPMPSPMLARDCLIFQKGAHTDQADIRTTGLVAANAIYFRYHQLEDDDIRDLVIPARVPTRSPEYELHRTYFIRKANEMERLILKWLEKGVENTISALGGLETFQKATCEERTLLWRNLFHKDKIGISQGLTGRTYHVIDIEGIWGGNAPEQEKWQIYLRTCFIWACEDIYEDMVSNEKNHVGNWNVMPRRVHFTPLELGDEGDIPVKGLVVESS
ncbi:MAG: hypothetical protein M1812_006069 [Candelaria pacifica]|nr:MAG: hypothetical protein M1812_006069 [Candelaria pacifica]